MLANSTGWTEHFILWELPLTRGLQYEHAIAVMNGAKTIETTASAVSELEQLTKQNQKSNG